MRFQSFFSRWVGLCRRTVTTASSVRPSGWRFAILQGRTTSPEPPRHWPSFKRPQEAPRHRRSSLLNEVDIWSARQSKTDKRGVSVRLTRKGQRALARDPLEGLVGAISSLSAREQSSLQHSLRRILSAPSLAGGYQQFGTCQDCAYVGGVSCCKQRQKNPECLLLGMTIHPDETDLICVHFEPKDAYSAEKSTTPASKGSA